MGLGDTEAAVVGAWSDCTSVEWTVSMPGLSVEIGVIGPFEEGFLNKEIGERTFNLAVSGVKNVSAGESAVACQPLAPRRPPPAQPAHHSRNLLAVQSAGLSTATRTDTSSPPVSRADWPAAQAQRAL